MPGIDFSIGQNDTGVPWSIPVLDAEGQPVDLTQPGTLVSLHYRIEDESAPAVTVTGGVVGTLAPAAAGYTFQSSDTAVPGRYSANFLVTLPSGERITAPPDRHLTFEVIEQV